MEGGRTKLLLGTMTGSVDEFFRCLRRREDRIQFPQYSNSECTL